MKLGSLKEGGRDGTLVVVSRSLERCVPATNIASTLQEALDNWETISPQLEKLAKNLENNQVGESVPFSPKDLASPLPRAYQWADGSAYLSHMHLVRKARGAELPKDAEKEPLMYQGGSDSFLAPTDPIPLTHFDWGLDFEAEIAIVTGDVPAGVSVQEAGSYIQLLMLCNDVSLRNIMKPELVKGFGFFQSKPASAFSPVCVTIDELGDAWDGGKLSLPLISTLNGVEFGHPNAGHDLSFDFPRLIAHAAKTRALAAGTIIGSGTVSNKNYKEVGSSCIQEKRMIEMIETGTATTPFLKVGDTIKLEMFDPAGLSVFGAIEQIVASN